MKKFLCFMFICILFITGCKNSYNKTIDDNLIIIQESGNYLDITVFIPQKNLDKFESHDNYIDLLTEAFADYLNLSNDSEFECPGLETVSEKKGHNGHTTLFRIQRNFLKILKK